MYGLVPLTDRPLNIANFELPIRKPANSGLKSPLIDLNNYSKTIIGEASIKILTRQRRFTEIYCLGANVFFSVHHGTRTSSITNSEGSKRPSLGDFSLHLVKNNVNCVPETIV